MEIARYIVAHPHLTVKQLAFHFKRHEMTIYQVIWTCIDIRKTLSIKPNAKPLQWPYDYEAP